MVRQERKFRRLGGEFVAPGMNTSNPLVAVRGKLEEYVVDAARQTHPTILLNFGMVIVSPYSVNLLSALLDVSAE